MTEYSAQDMALRNLRIQRQKGNLVYKFGQETITKEAWVAIAEAPLPEVVDGK